MLEEVSVLISVGSAGITAVNLLRGALKGRSELISLKGALFPEFRNRAIVTTGRLANRNLDPEDLRAARTLLGAYHGLWRRRQEYRQITFVEDTGEVDVTSHVVAIGGPLSNPLNRRLSHMPPFHRRMRPRLPLFMFINPRTKKRVIRAFDGRPHPRPMWLLRDSRSEVSYEPGVSSDDWLTRDYLVVSVLPLSSTSDSRNLVSFMGLYGTGLMALDLLLSNKEGALETMARERGRSRYFQSVFAIEKIRHRTFSRGTVIRHLVTHQLEENVV